MTRAHIGPRIDCILHFPDSSGLQYQLIGLDRSEPVVILYEIVSLLLFTVRAFCPSSAGDSVRSFRACVSTFVCSDGAGEFRASNAEIFFPFSPQKRCGSNEECVCIEKLKEDDPLAIMPLLEKDHIYFHADHVEATFPDGNNIHYNSEDIQATKSPGGDDVIILRQGTDNHLIRLYLTTPSYDWRRGQTYRWQLSTASMIIPGTEQNGNQTDWLYWNIENNINSQVKVYSPVALFSCESITLHFREMSRTPWNDPQSSEVPKTEIVMKGDVLIGANLTEATTHSARYRPCQSSVCGIVDGIVASESFLGVEVPSALPGAVPVFLVVIAVVVPLLWIILACHKCCQRRMLPGQYDPIVGDNDLNMKEEEEGGEGGGE